MLFEATYYGVWVLSSLTCLAAAARLWRANRHLGFKTFFAYLILVGIHGLINLGLSLFNPVAWFYSFFIGTLITSLLGFAVLYEASQAAISTPVFKLRSNSFFTICAVAGVIASIVCLNVDVNGSDFSRVRVLIEMALRVMQVSILLVFATVSALFGLFWRRTEFGVVLGYGCYAAVQLALMTHRASITGDAPYLVLLPMISFLASAVIWLLYSGMKEPPAVVDAEILIPEIDDSLRFAQRMQS
jgi:hypothetical protein